MGRCVSPAGEIARRATGSGAPRAPPGNAARAAAVGGAMRAVNLAASAGALIGSAMCGGVPAARADDALRLRMRALDEAPPALGLDALAPGAADAAGGVTEHHGGQLALGPRTRLVAEGTWWQSGASPGRFAEDLPFAGWRARAALIHDLGPLRIGLHATAARTRDGGHRALGLSIGRAVELSRWMHAWIELGVAYETWDGASPADADARGLRAGLTLGTTFR